MDTASPANDTSGPAGNIQDVLDRMRLGPGRIYASLNARSDMPINDSEANFMEYYGKSPYVQPNGDDEDCAVYAHGKHLVERAVRERLDAYNRAKEGHRQRMVRMQSSILTADFIREVRVRHEEMLRDPALDIMQELLSGQSVTVARMPKATLQLMLKCALLNLEPAANDDDDDDIPDLVDLSAVEPASDEDQQPITLRYGGEIY